MKSDKASTVLKKAFRLAGMGLLLLAPSAAWAAFDAPHIDILQPISARPGGPDFTLTILGAGLVDGTTLDFDGEICSTACNLAGTQCTTTVSAESIATTHTASVTAVGPGGASNVVLFPVTYPTPRVSTSGGPLIAAQRTDLALRGDSFAMADFNNDGKLDVAVNRVDALELAIRLGDGMGGFEAAPPLPAAPGLLTRTVGDFDGDGNVDLVALNRSLQTVTVLLGDGGGGFSAAPSSATGDSPWAAVAGDFNGDGNLDLAVTINGDDTLTILLGDGTGGFSALPPIATGGSPDSLAAGDFNRDGHLDLVVVGSPIKVLLGDGTGNFASTSLSHSIAGSVAAGDFNGDGKLDVAVANRLSKSNSVTILRGNGTGGFQLFPQSFPAGILPTDITAGDFNGDGKLDLATVSIENDGSATSVGCLSGGTTGISFPGGLNVLLGDGKGDFSRHTVVDNTGACPLAMAAGDFNGDGRIDSIGQYPGPPFNPGGFLSLYLQRLYPIAVPSPDGILDFGDQVVSIAYAPRTIALTNSGTVPLHVTDVTVESGFEGVFSFSHDCFTSSPLAPGKSCTAEITFTPLGESTIYILGTATFTSDSGLFGFKQQHVNLRGRGQGVPLSISPASLTFGDQLVNTTSPAMIATVTNIQTVPVMVDQITLVEFNAETGEPLTQPGAFAFASGTTCPMSGAVLEPGASCALAATFTPTATGNFFASARLSMNGFADLQRVTLSGFGFADTTPPTITPVISGPLGANGWYVGDVSLTWDVQDNESAITSTSGCDPASVTSDTAGVTFTCTATSAGGTASESVTIMLDKTPPMVACGAPDGLWHNADVAIGCTADGAISGLANLPNAGFNLMTSVPANTENANAATNSASVYDKAGNFTVAGPIAGNKVDKKAPDITINSPAATVYLLNQAVASDYFCSDGGSGLASCVGPVASGQNFSTSVPGANSFTVNASDQVANASSATNTYQVQYQPAGTMCNGAPGHQILQPIKADGTSIFRQKSTVPTKFRVCDANGVSIGTPGVVSSFYLIQIISGTVTSDVSETALSTTPDTAFRWDSTDQQWIFNISNENLSANSTYVFRISLIDGTHIDFQYGLK